MTPAATPEALAEALASSLNDSFRGITFCGSRWSEAACNIAVANLLSGPLAPLLAALQQVTAERDGYRDGEEISDVMAQVGFDRMMEVCKERDTAEAALATATAEAASLRAEVEALKGSLDQTKAAADELVPVCLAEGDNKAAGALQFISGFVSDRLAAIEDTALARAATAGEGRSDG